MKEVILKRLVRTYYESTLGEPKGFPFWGDLCEFAGEKDPVKVFYELLGYIGVDRYSSEDIYKIRREDAKRNYELLREMYRVKKMDQLSSLISKLKAKSNIMKKGTIPSEIWEEVKALSEYIRLEDNLLVAIGENYHSVASILLKHMKSLKELEEYADTLTSFVSKSISFALTNDKVKCYNFTLYGREEFSEKMRTEIIRSAIIAFVIPYLYMDIKRAFQFYLDKGSYQLKANDEDYLQYIDQLHHKNVTMGEVFRSIGLNYYSPLKVYQELGVLAHKPNKNLILVANDHADNLMLSPEEFEFCRENDYLQELSKDRSGELTVTGINMSLQTLRSVSAS